MQINGVTYEPMRVMQPSGDEFVIYVPAAEAVAIKEDQVIRFAYSRNQSFEPEE